MARTEDLRMKQFRARRRRLSARLAKAEREGRLGEELDAIEREALDWWERASSRAKKTRKAAR